MSKEIPVHKANLGRALFQNITNQPVDTVTNLRKLWEAHGDIVCLKIAGRKLIIASSPDLAHEILINKREIFKKTTYLENNRDPLSPVLGNGLVTNHDTDHWRGQRRMVQPMFHRRRIATMAQKMTDAGDRMLARWESEFADGQEIEIDHQMMLTTMDIITQTMFSTDIMANADSIGENVNDALEAAFKVRGMNSALPLWFPNPAKRTLKQAVSNLDEGIQNIIDERRDNPADYDDLLSMLLDARDEETGEPMPPQQLLDEVKTIFGAGHETTSHALTWTLYLLATHPEEQAKVQAEIDAILQGRTPEMADLPALNRTRMVFEEALRLYPAAPVTARINQEETEMCGYPVDQHTVVILSMFNIHHHPDFWDAPDQFRPDRFETDGWKEKHRLAYMPFGGGQRLCVGNHFAMMEAQFLLAQMLQKYTFKPVAGYEPQMELAVTLRPRDGLPLILERRN